MVVFGNKSSSAKTKLFEQPLDKLFSPKAIKQLNEAISASNQINSKVSLTNTFSVPLTSSTITWAKLSQENSAIKRKRTLARLRRFTIDANNNANLISSISSVSTASSTTVPSPSDEVIDTNKNVPNKKTNLLRTTTSNIIDNHDYIQQQRNSNVATSSLNQINEEERCRLLLEVLPTPIKRLLNELYLRGPDTIGIFRKSPNAKHCKELRQKLETSDGQSSIQDFQVTVIASVFKEWLRSLPDCLLMSRLYPQWIDVAKLIEPLHASRQQQTTQHQAGIYDRSTPTKTEPTSSRLNHFRLLFQDNMDAAKRNLISTCSSGLGPSCSVTDSGIGQRRRELSRALSCSIMTSDSGQSSASPSSSLDAELPDSPTRASTDMISTVIINHSQNNDNSTNRYSRRHQFKTVNSRRDKDQRLDNEHKLNNHQSDQMTQREFQERYSECIKIVRQLLEVLNEANLITLRAIICVLWHIAKNSDYNKMSSQNLGVCIGQSLLNGEQQQKKGQSIMGLYSMRSSSNLSTSPTSAAASAIKSFSANTFTKRHKRTRSQCLLASTLSLTNLSYLSSSPSINSCADQNMPNTNTGNHLDSSGPQEAAKYVPILVAFMIDNAEALFGSDTVKLFGKHPSEHKQSIECDGNNLANDSNRSTLLVVDSSLASSVDNSQQPRPQSATESTSSSSRASSSTSGVHSDSPAFSSETDHHQRDGQATTCSSSLSTSTSSPDPCSSGPSVCTQPWIQQQVPQRTHVMMLRDYYLSLQEQNQRSQHVYVGSQNQYKSSVKTTPNLINCAQNQRQDSTSQYTGFVSRMQQQAANFQPQHSTMGLQHHHDSYSSYIESHSNDNGRVYQQQPASAAIVYQRIQPRLAKIRQNQFNKLYVKKACSPQPDVVISISVGTNCDSGLTVRPLDDSDSAAPNLHRSSLMTSSRCSLSQKSSKLSSTSSTEHSDDESDDCSTGEWMESTMV